MKDSDVIIIGAGACGLMAARELLKNGKQVTILEARDRAGGRINTLRDGAFSIPVELGAEFVHGNLPVTLRLLKDAGLTYRTMEWRGWQAKNGELTPSESFIEDWGLLEKRLKELKHDMSIADFLDYYFNDIKYSELKKSVKGFVEGYDAADTTRASTFALRDEWLNENEEPQFRVNGGYRTVTDFLAHQCTSAGGNIHLSAVVKEIRWEQNHVSVITEDDKIYTSGKTVITVPLGVLQQEEKSKGAITFSPTIPGKIAALRLMGFGSVIKIFLEFKDPFWQYPSDEKSADNRRRDIGFLFSDESIPTWWTQLPEQTALLTGWLAGPRTEKFALTSEENILHEAIHSLASIFGRSDAWIKEKLTAWRVSNWTADPFARGAYSYATLDTSTARKELSQPVENTLFFAGEALYDGKEMGSIEAALANGLQVASRVLAAK